MRNHAQFIPFQIQLTIPMPTNTNPCGPAAQHCSEQSVNLAILDQQPLISYNVTEKFIQNDDLVVKMVSTGEDIYSHQDSRTVINGVGFQAPVAYKSYDDPFKADCESQLVPGFQTAQGTCSATNVQIGTMVNALETNLCDGVTIVESAQGYRIRGSHNYQIKIATKQRCIETLAKKDPRIVLQLLENEASSFAQTAVVSYNKLINDFVVFNGGANSVVRDFILGDPQLTSGGWNIGNLANPQNAVQHVTVHFLERYSALINQRMIGYGLVTNSKRYVPVFAMTRQAWKEALEHHLTNRVANITSGQPFGGNIRLDEKIFSRGEALEGRAYDDWNGIFKVVFIADSIHGFNKQVGFTPSGVPIYQFVPISMYLNAAAEQAGVVGGLNPEYFQETTICDGVEYDVVEQIPHIYSGSFVVHNIKQGVAPKGVNPGSTKFKTQLVTGAMLSSAECPNFGEKKYQYFAENLTRIREVYPELTGVILHRPKIALGYNIPRNPRPLIVTTTPANTTPTPADKGIEMKCHPECPEAAPCKVGDNKTSMSPCGNANVGFYGTKTRMRFEFCRDSKCCDGKASVTTEFVAGTARGGVQFQPVTSTGTLAVWIEDLTWADGESGCKYRYADIIGAIPNTPASVDPRTGAVIPAIIRTAEFTLRVNGTTGTAMNGCTTTTVIIKDRR